MGEVAPHIRILLYIVGSLLASHGVPREISSYISTDPAVFELASQVVGFLLAGGAYVFWRIAKRFGWNT